MFRNPLPLIFLLAFGFAFGQVEGAGAQVQPSEDALRATHGDWEIRCAEGGESICYMSQIVNNAEGSPLLRAVLRKVDQGQAEAVLTIQAPLGVVLTQGLTMRIDTSEAQQAPFLYCVQNGCYAQIVVAEEGLNRLRGGSTARLTVYSVQQPETPVEVDLSLMGFTAGYGALN